MRRATVHVDLATKSCVITSRRRFYGSWGPDITRREVEGVIAADGWRFTPGSTWTMTIDGGTRQVERPGPIRRLIERLVEQYRERAAIRASDRYLDNVDSATPPADTDDELTARLLAARNATEADPIPGLVDTDTAIATIHKGEAA